MPEIQKRISFRLGVLGILTRTLAFKPLPPVATLNSENYEIRTLQTLALVSKLPQLRT